MNIKEEYGLTQKEYEEVLEIIERTFGESDKSYGVHQYLCYAQMLLKTICNRMIKDSDVMTVDKCKFIMLCMVYNVVAELED